MAQYVAKLHSDQASDLWDYVRDMKAFANAAVTGTTELEFRNTDPAEAEALADQLAAFRDLLGLTSVRITYHVCRHDEGIGHCAAVVVEK